MGTSLLLPLAGDHSLHTAGPDLKNQIRTTKGFCNGQNKTTTLTRKEMGLKKKNKSGCCAIPFKYPVHTENPCFYVKGKGFPWREPHPGSVTPPRKSCSCGKHCWVRDGAPLVPAENPPEKKPSLSGWLLRRVYDF